MDSPCSFCVDMPVTGHLVSLFFARIFEHNSNEEITVHSFLSCVGQLKFRGTSGLLRLPKPLFSHKEGIHPDHAPPSPVLPLPEEDLEDKATRDNEQQRTFSEGTDSGEESAPPTKEVLHNRRRGVLPDVAEEMEVSPLEEQASNGAPPKKKPQLSINIPTSRQTAHNSHHLQQQQEEETARGTAKHHHSDEEYSIATHFVKVRRNGLLVDVSTLWDFMATDAVTGSVRNILSHSRPGVQRQSSIFAFNPVRKLHVTYKFM